MERAQSPDVSFRAWLRATWLGWLLGIPLIVVMALLGEAIGVGGAQVFVGLGMGVGIGLLQQRAIRPLLPGGAAWFWACAVGLAIPFLATDVAGLLGRPLPYSLPLAVLTAGLVVGCWQAWLLRVRLRNAGLWVLASAVGWAGAAGVAGAADVLSRGRYLRGLFGALAYLGAVAGGGFPLALVTAAALVRLQGRPRAR